MTQFIRLTKDINRLAARTARGLLKGNVFSVEYAAMGVYIRDWKDGLTRIFISECEIIEDNRCNTCGKPGTIYETCPYLGELFPEDDNPEVFWCGECYQESLDNI